jgi:hypothetical protein
LESPPQHVAVGSQDLEIKVDLCLRQMNLQWVGACLRDRARDGTSNQFPDGAGVLVAF